MATEINGAAPLAVRQVLDRARDSASGGRADDAAWLYEELLAVDPGNADALAGLASLHHRRGEHAQAELLLERALTSDPRDGELRDALLDVRTTRGAQRRRSVGQKVAGRLRPGLWELAQRPRRWKYQALSSCERVSGRPVRNQPVLFLGEGEVLLGEHVQFGWRQSPLYFTGYCLVEASTPGSRIELGDRTEFNNNLMIKSEGPGIRVGRDGLFGANIEIFDSNFHDLDPARRVGGNQKMAPVDIAENVFVGMGVKILKGVTIGANSVVGAGTVVSSSIPADVIVAGNPARVVRAL